MCHRPLSKDCPVLATVESLHNAGLKMQRHGVLYAFGWIRKKQNTLTPKKSNERSDVALSTLFDWLVCS